MCATADWSFNGIYSDSGEPLVSDASTADFARLAVGGMVPAEELARLERIYRQRVEPTRGLPVGVDPTDYTDSGWGVVFAEEEASDIRAAVARLVEHRRSAFNHPRKREQRCKVLEYRGERTARDWIVTQGGDSASVDPRKVPYYLLLIGGPERIPFHFSNDLDVEYCVGRLAFETAAEYASYVESLIRHETGTQPASSRALFFAPRCDASTRMSADVLVRPLVMGTPEDKPVCVGTGFVPQLVWDQDATKQELREILTGADRPALVFTASHGIGIRCGSPNQRDRQGALVCSDWPGSGPVGADHLLGASDIPKEADLTGMVSFHFACFSAGTPEYDQIGRDADAMPARLADQPFVAALPQRTLSIPGGAALGCFGHVDTALGAAICNPRSVPQLLPFRNLVRRLLLGLPLGMALDDFNVRFASLSTTLATQRNLLREGTQIPEEEIARCWLHRNEAGGYVLLGDPAAKLRLPQTQGLERP